MALGVADKKDRTGALDRAWRQGFTNHLKGDYLETGVYKGNSFIENKSNIKVFAAGLKGDLKVLGHSDKKCRKFY